MSESNDQSSDTGSDINWPLDHPLESTYHEQVLFENVPDQYVKGDDVTVFFTILNDIKVNPDEDQIGLSRIGYTSIKGCLVYAPVQITPSTGSGAARHGTATFPSTSLPETDDEFYQFCYILNKTKSLGSSLPFQLNCSSDDIDLLVNGTIGKNKADKLIAMDDRDQDDMVVIHSKGRLIEEKLRQENRHLLEIKSRLEMQKEELQSKLDVYEEKTNDHIARTKAELQTLVSTHSAAVVELSSRQRSESKLLAEYDACRALCEQYQNESLQSAERCRTLEDAQGQIVNETSQYRSQLAVTSQLIKDQATQIIDLERRLMQSNEQSKLANHRQATLEQILRDLRLTSEKHQMSAQGLAESQLKQIADQSERIQGLESSNASLKQEIKSLYGDNECLAQMSQRDKDLSQELQDQLQELREEYRMATETAQKEIAALQAELTQGNGHQESTQALKTSVAQMEKICLKHQKSQIEATKQAAVYKNFIEDLQREIDQLTDRLNQGADEYKTLFRKYTALERKNIQPEFEERPKTPIILPNVSDLNNDELHSLLRNAFDVQQQDADHGATRRSLDGDGREVPACPMCCWAFPANMTVDQKTEHIEGHFQ